MKTITGLFESPYAAGEAVRVLERSTVSPSKISIVASDRLSKDSFGIKEHSKLAEGAAVGAGLGGAVGAVIAGLTLVGAVATGGGALLAAGPIVAALAGAGTGAAAGGMLGLAAGSFIPTHEIEHYNDAIHKGSVLVGVQCENDDISQRVKDVFEQQQAMKITSV
ncbi:MAG: hypothetical protein WC718_12920 [Phycisphaerales bacterium]